MLTIRLQRTGRKAHAMFRVVVQDSRRTPTSGKIVTQLGHYDPHAKTVVIDKEKAEFYLKNGAQPSPRAVKLLKIEKIKLPDWVKEEAKKTKTVKNVEKLRKNAPKEEVVPEETTNISEATEEIVTEEAEKIVDEAASETPKEEVVPEEKA